MGEWKARRRGYESRSNTKKGYLLRGQRESRGLTKGGIYGEINLIGGRGRGDYKRGGLRGIEFLGNGGTFVKKLDRQRGGA